MKNISQRAATISLILNGILIILCLGFYIYSRMQKTEADRLAEMAMEQRIELDSLTAEVENLAKIAATQRALAEKQRALAEEAYRDGELRRLEAEKAASNK